MNETHDAALRSWVGSANEAHSEFPIQNLPYAAFRDKRADKPFQIGVAIGNQILPLEALTGLKNLSSLAAQAARAGRSAVLNDLMECGPAAWGALRLSLSRNLRDGADAQSALSGELIPMSEAEFAVPVRIGDFTDMYTSIDHALNVGRLFRPDSPLMPNFRWIPCGYHARVSSIGVSGQRFARPGGQILPPGASEPIFSASRRLDYELELAIWIGQGNALGNSIPLDQAEQHVFGISLLNDWSARDIQAWEYQPLGPLLSKNFATTVSPWVITMEALEPFRVPWTRAPQDPQPLAYLESAANRAAGALDIQVESWLLSEAMTHSGLSPFRLSASSFRHCYWSVAQMIAHHTVNGCNLQVGDLIGSGTQSGPGPGEAGALIEISKGGKEPLALPSGESRTFLEDGDTVILRAACRREGYRSIGFGECAGTVLPARTQPTAST
jgi:fumarylacetoacetase